MVSLILIIYRHLQQGVRHGISEREPNNAERHVYPGQICELIVSVVVAVVSVCCVVSGRQEIGFFLGGNKNMYGAVPCAFNMTFTLKFDLRLLCYYLEFSL